MNGVFKQILIVLILVMLGILLHGVADTVLTDVFAGAFFGYAGAILVRAVRSRPNVTQPAVPAAAAQTNEAPRQPDTSILPAAEETPQPPATETPPAPDVLRPENTDTAPQHRITRTIKAMENPLREWSEATVEEEAAALQRATAQQQAAALSYDFRTKIRIEMEKTVDKMLDVFISMVGSRLPHRTVAVFFPTPSGSYALRRHNPSSTLVNKDAAITPNCGILGDLLTTGLCHYYKPNFRPDRTHALHYYDEKHTFTPEEGIRSIMLDPIEAAGETMGILLVDSTKENIYSKADEEFLANAARFLGITLHNTYMNTEHSIEYQRLTAMSIMEKDFWKELEFDAVMNKVFDSIPHTTPCDRITISRKDRDKMSATIVRAYGMDAEEFLALPSFPLSENSPPSIARVAYKDERGFFKNFRDDQYETRYSVKEPKRSELASFIAIPFGIDSIKGLILLESVKKDAFTQFNIDQLSSIATSAGIVLDKIFMIKQIEYLATHDEMTKLYNHRRYMEIITEKITACQRYNYSFSLVMCDIDFFKKINDTYGHPVGDSILKDVAARLRNGIRDKIDVAARYGGEEFVLIFDKMGPEEAKESTERIRSAIESAPFYAGGHEIRVTMSFGIASFPNHSDEMDDLKTKADETLYKAKRGGRNRVEVYK